MFADNFKKRNKKWQYHPDSVVVDDYYFIVKDGQKSGLEKDLEKDQLLALSLPSIVICLGLIHKFMGLLLVPVVPYLMYRKSSYLKKYCLETEFNKRRFFRNIIKRMYYHGDYLDKKEHALIGLVPIMFTAFAYKAYIDLHSIYIVLFLFVFGIYGLFFFILISIRKMRSTKQTTGK